MTAAYEIIGFIGSFIISAALVPQVTKVYRTKSADDISYPFVCMYITGLLCLGVYGFGESLWPIYVPSSFELIGAIGLLVLKIRYEARGPTGDMEHGLVETLSKSDSTQRMVAVLTPK
jgi:MtN3 and saliva related transmembrane protein